MITIRNRMEELISKMNNMSQKELAIFLEEGYQRAKHVLDEEYNEERDFRIVGEEMFYEDKEKE